MPHTLAEWLWFFFERGRVNVINIGGVCILEYWVDKHMWNRINLAIDNLKAVEIWNDSIVKKKGNRATMHLLFYLFLILLLNIMIWDNLFCKGSCVKKMWWNLLWQLQIKKGRFWLNHFSSQKISLSKKQMHVLGNIFIFLQSRLSQVFTRFDRNWLESQPMARNEFITETIGRKPPSSLPFFN